MRSDFARKHASLLIMVGLATLTIAVYWQTFGHSFIGYDDEQYITGNPYVQWGLTRDSVKWAFNFGYASNWHPLTWMSHMLDYELFGLSPKGPHAVNLLLHIANSLLLFHLLRPMTRSLWKSAFVAALFAIHPMHVESVAWVAERKDVLSTLFWMLTTLAYVKYAESPTTKRYVPVIVLFGLGLLAKPTLVTLPLTLLLLDYWPLCRLGKGKASPWSLIMEKLPLFVMTAGSCVATFFAQKAGGAVVELTERLTLAMRVDNALVSLVTYIAKMFWPHKMAIFYPHPAGSLPEWQVVGSVVLLLCVSLLAFAARRDRPYLVVGWIWFLLTLVPMIGLVQVGKAAMADRYTYISYVGLFIMLAWGVRPAPSRPFAVILTAVSALAVTALSIVTWIQVGHWTNEYTVFKHALEVTSRNDVAHIHVGNCLFKKGKTREAMSHYRESLRINPQSYRTHNNMGNALARLGDAAGAIREYNAALAIKENATAEFNLGNLYSKQGDKDKAIAHYESALDIQPDYSPARANLASLLMEQGRLDEALEQSQELARLLPNSAGSHLMLGMVLAKRKDTEDAIASFREAIRLRPGFARAHYNLGNALAAKGELDDALEAFEEAVRISPDYADAHFNIGVILDSREDMPQAMRAYRLAIKAKPGHAEAHANLAIDLFISGDYAGSWKEVELARKYGLEPNPDFIQALSAKMSPG